MTIATLDDFAVPSQHRQPEPAAAGCDHSLTAILQRKDDRLLDDVGLSRAEIMTAHEIFLREARVPRALWSL